MGRYENILSVFAPTWPLGSAADSLFPSDGINSFPGKWRSPDAGRARREKRPIYIHAFFPLREVRLRPLLF